jgi:hypothetical protein
MAKITRKPLLLQVVNFGNKAVSLNISVSGLETDIQTFGSVKTVLTSGWLRDENSFQQPDKVRYLDLRFNQWRRRELGTWQWFSLGFSISTVCDVWSLVWNAAAGGAGGKPYNQRTRADGCCAGFVLPHLIWSPLGLERDDAFSLGVELASKRVKILRYVATGGVFQYKHDISVNKIWSTAI